MTTAIPLERNKPSKTGVTTAPSVWEEVIQGRLNKPPLKNNSNPNWPPMVQGLRQHNVYWPGQATHPTRLPSQRGSLASADTTVSHRHIRKTPAATKHAWGGILLWLPKRFITAYVQCMPSSIKSPLSTPSNTKGDWNNMTAKEAEWRCLCWPMAIRSFLIIPRFEVSQNTWVT